MPLSSSWSTWPGATASGGPAGWRHSWSAAGGFQLYDGTVQHKLLGLHQIRYHVDLVPYDVAWNVVAVALIVAGLVLLRRTRARR